jgi:hypothetical protein
MHHDSFEADSMMLQNIISININSNLTRQNCARSKT